MKKILKYAVSTRDCGVPLGLLFVRVVGGILMMTHGFAKFSNFSEISSAFPDPLEIGSKLSLSLVIGAELVASFFVIIGLFSRLALIPIIFTMIVAFFVIHSADPFPVKELALLYMILFFGLFLTGPGKYSLDEIIYRKIKD